MLLRSHAERMQAHHDKRRRLLAFLSSETWTTPAVAADLLGLRARSAVSQTLRGLAREGLVVIEDVVGPGRRARVVGITPEGQAHIATLLGRPMELRAYARGRVGLATIEHRTGLQRLRIAAARAGWRGWVYPDRQTPGKARAPHRPDAIVTRPDGARVAVELELTLKSIKRYRAVVGAHLGAIRAREYDLVAYICPDPGRAAAVQRAIYSLGRVLVGGRDTPLTPDDLGRLLFCTPGDLFKESRDECE